MTEVYHFILEVIRSILVCSLIRANQADPSGYLCEGFSHIEEVLQLTRNNDFTSWFRTLNDFSEAS